MKGRIWWCCNPNSWKVEVEGSQVQGQPRLYQETDAVKKNSPLLSSPEFQTLAHFFSNHLLSPIYFVYFMFILSFMHLL